jgi:hypothetical protein
MIFVRGFVIPLAAICVVGILTKFLEVIGENRKERLKIKMIKKKMY